jgi:hypothetical protein
LQDDSKDGYNVAIKGALDGLAKATSGSLCDEVAAVSASPDQKLRCNSVHAFYRKYGPNVDMRAECFSRNPSFVNHGPENAQALDECTGQYAKKRWNSRKEVLDILTMYFSGPDNVAHAIGATATPPPGWTSGPALGDVDHPLTALRQQLEKVTDAQFKEVVDAIDKDGYLYATLFVLSADHGQHAYQPTDPFCLAAEEAGNKEIQLLFEPPGVDMKLWRGDDPIGTCFAVYERDLGS